MMSKITVKIKKLDSKAVIPTYGTDGSAGMDITALDSIRYTNDFIEYSTGLSFEIPEGHVMKIYPRSSISKYDLVLCNNVPIIDSDYRGEVLLRFKIVRHELSSHQDPKIYQSGDKIAQLMIESYPKVDFTEVVELTFTNRGSGGFGSTGK